MAETKSNRDLAARFGRAASAQGPQRQQPAPVVDKQPPAGDEKNEQGQPSSKFTVIFNWDEAEAFDELIVTARHHLRRRVDKSEIVRALLQLTYSDPSLEQQLIKRLRQ